MSHFTAVSMQNLLHVVSRVHCSWKNPLQLSEALQLAESTVVSRVHCSYRNVLQLAESTVVSRIHCSYLMYCSQWNLLWIAESTEVCKIHNSQQNPLQLAESTELAESTVLKQYQLQFAEFIVVTVYRVYSHNYELNENAEIRYCNSYQSLFWEQ